MEVVTAVIMGLVGLLLGGIINILADDLPERRNPRSPRYPDGTPRAPLAWLGVLAFLSGQRESPSAPGEAPALAEESNPFGLMGMDGDAVAGPPSRVLSWRHPVVEIGTALAFAAMAFGFAGNDNLPVWLVYVAIMVLVTVIDVEHRLILFVVMVPSALFALIVAAVAPPDAGREFGYYLAGGLVGFGLYFMMFLGGVVFSAATRPGTVAFGFGDVMLGTLSGLMLGWRAFIFAALITVFVGAFGAIFYLSLQTMSRENYRKFTPLPYGPYIVIGTLVMLLFREDVQELLRQGVY